MRPTSVLVVDDEPRLVRYVRANLESMGYRVLGAYEGQTALNLAERENPDLIMLDIVMPGMDGIEVCQRVREFSDVPVIVLTAKGEEADKVKGFNAGADDYVTKPFGAEELLARVKAVLRRCSPDDRVKARSSFVHGDFCIDYLRNRVTVRGQEIVLSATEYKLLWQLTTNAGRVVLHEGLLSRVWGPEYREEIDYLRVYVHHLRQKIEEDPSKPKYILSRPGIGYYFASADARGIDSQATLM
ncbi:MAG: response regulator transcription factor [Chloroflexi bacterium]|nr:response regulator transcription factor [Chloroflexota bacterium]